MPRERGINSLVTHKRQMHIRIRSPKPDSRTSRHLRQQVTYIDIHFNYCDIFSTQYVSWSLHTCLAFRVIKFFNYPVFLILIREEYRVKKSLKFLVAAAGLMAISAATAGTFSTAPCKACHAVDKDVVGPAWKRVAEKYGNEEALAKVFKGGFKVEDRKIASTEPKFKSQAAIMTGQYNTLIKGHEDEAAKALFAAVKSGKM